MHHYGLSYPWTLVAIPRVIINFIFIFYISITPPYFLFIPFKSRNSDSLQNLLKKANESSPSFLRAGGGGGGRSRAGTVVEVFFKLVLFILSKQNRGIKRT